MSRLHRRRFLYQSAVGMSAAALGAPLIAADKKRPPGERLRVGVIGVNGQGAANLAGVAKEDIVALCDIDETRAGAARQAHPHAKFYQDFRRVLDHKEIEAVVVSTPDHMHAIPVVMAMRAGKHIYCEKPLAHSVHEVRTMMALAAENKIVTQMGTQIHALDNYRRVVEIVRAGVLGPIERVQVWCHRRPDVRRLAPKPVPATFAMDLWLGPAPAHPYDMAYIPFHWRWFWTFGGGVLADMACHFMDLPHWALDLRAPVRVEAAGKKDSPGDQDVPDIIQVDYRYPARADMPAVHLTWYSGVPGPGLDSKAPFEGFSDGVLFEGSKGKLVADYTRHRLLPEKEFEGFVAPKPTIPTSVGHHREWLDAIRAGGTTTCNFAYSGALAETVLLGNVAFRCGKAFAWDDTAGKADVPEAAAFLRRDYRKGWSL